MGELVDKKFLIEALGVAESAARSSGKILLSKYREIISTNPKGSKIQDLVTSADLESEKNIKQKIQATYPHHASLGEETGYHGSRENDFVWFIDPLDGTANFVSQIPFFAISVSLVFKNESILGVIYLPVQKELYTAVYDKGAFLNGKKTKTSRTTNLKTATLSFCLGKTEKGREWWLKRITRFVGDTYKLRSFGSTAMSCAFLASGRIDGHLAVGDFWDMAAGNVLIREAGGVTSDERGEKLTSKSKIIVAGNPKIHAEILKKITL